MLIYHFGSREGLLAAVTRVVEDASSGPPCWSRARPRPRRPAILAAAQRPQLRPQERLFFELYAYALRGRPGTEGFLDGSSSHGSPRSPMPWSKPAPTNRTARADARLGVAAVRGLLLDLVATGDRAGVDEAYERFLARARPPMRHPGKRQTPTATPLMMRDPASRQKIPRPQP